MYKTEFLKGELSRDYILLIPCSVYLRFRFLTFYKLFVLDIALLHLLILKLRYSSLTTDYNA